MEKNYSMGRALVFAAAGVSQGNWKRAVSKAAENTGLSYRMVKSVFYGAIADEDHKAIRRLSEAANRNVPISAADALDWQASNMEHADPEMYGEVVDVLRRASRALRGMVR